MAGVPWETFWHLSPRKLEPYFKAQEMRQKYETYRANNTAWIAGIYVQAAIAASLSKSAKYPNKPIDFDAKPETDAQKFAKWVAEHNRARRERERNGG